MKTVNKPVHEVRFLRKTSCVACRRSKNEAEYYFLRCLLRVTHAICNSSATIQLLIMIESVWYML